MANYKFDLLRSNGNDYDTLYPKTIWSQIEPTTIPSTFAPTAHSHAASDITQTASYRFVTDTEKTTWNAKQSALTNPVTGTGTASTLAYWNGTGTIASLATSTYPSLTEIGYVKGVTSNIQSQISGKAAGTHAHGNIGTGGTITSAVVTTATNDCILISDATNSGKIERGIAINSTHGNAFLRKDGNWSTLAASDVGALSTSGGTVSGDITLSPTATTQADQKGIKWKSISSKNPYFGYALDQTDGTFVWSITGTNYASGLAIGGGSGNLLYKGGIVVTANNISSYAPTYGYATSTTAGLVRISVSGTTVNIITQ